MLRNLPIVPRLVGTVLMAGAVVGLLAAWLANRVIAKTWTQMGEILSQQTPVVPGEAGGAS